MLLISINCIFEYHLSLPLAVIKSDTSSQTRDLVVHHKIAMTILFLALVLNILYECCDKCKQKYKDQNPLRRVKEKYLPETYA